MRRDRLPRSIRCYLYLEIPAQDGIRLEARIPRRVRPRRSVGLLRYDVSKRWPEGLFYHEPRREFTQRQRIRTNGLDGKTFCRSLQYLERPPAHLQRTGTAQ